MSSVMINGDGVKVVNSAVPANDIDELKKAVEKAQTKLDRLQNDFTIRNNVFVDWGMRNDVQIGQLNTLIYELRENLTEANTDLKWLRRDTTEELESITAKIDFNDAAIMGLTDSTSKDFEEVRMQRDSDWKTTVHCFILADIMFVIFGLAHLIPAIGGLIG